MRWVVNYAQQEINKQNVSDFVKISNDSNLQSIIYKTSYFHYREGCSRKSFNIEASNVVDFDVFRHFCNE